MTEQPRNASAVTPSRRVNGDAPDPLAERRRSWVVVGMAVCLVTIFTAIWVTYAKAHTVDRYEQLPPGASTTQSGASMKVVSLQQTDVVTDGDEIHPAAANAVWVVVTMEATLPKGKKKLAGCQLELLSDGGRVWSDPELFFSRKLPQYCGDDDDPPKPGVPWRFEQIFEIPQRFADHLYGVVVPDNSSAEPNKVLRPST
jgi:hypothetical protein